MTTSESPLPGTELVGMPYDITGRYANAESVNLSAALFDFPSTQGQKSERIQDQYYTYSADRCAVAVLNEAIQVYTEYEDASAAAQRYSFGVSGQYRTAMFGGSVRAGFSIAYASSTYMKSVARRSIVRTYSLSLPYTLEELRGMLTRDADAAINGAMDPAAVINAYGTHVLAKAVFGGLNEYSQSVSSLNNRTTAAAEVAVNANYVRFEGAAQGSVSTDQISSASQSNAVMQVYGGDPVTLNSTYEAWAASLDKGNWVMVDFPHDPGALIPLASLARTQERRDALNKAMNDKLEKAGDPVAGMTALRWDKTREKAVKVQGSGDVVSLRVESESQVIVGYGASVTKKEISRAVLHVLDLATNVTFEIWANSDHRIERDANVPLSVKDEYGNPLRGLAAVGVGAVAQDNDMQGITLWYEELDPTNSAGNQAVAYTSPTYLSGDRRSLVAGASSVEAYYQCDPGWILTEIGLGMDNSDDTVRVMNVSTAPMVQWLSIRIRCVNSSTDTVQHWSVAGDDSLSTPAGWTGTPGLVEGEVAPQQWAIVGAIASEAGVSVQISVTADGQTVTGNLTFHAGIGWMLQTPYPDLMECYPVEACGIVLCSLGDP
ncbi:MAG: MAC/perforin domain-containing protein [Nannocystaceae bacterium]